MFYKVIQDNQIIDVLDTITFVKIQIIHKILIICEKEFAEGILSSNGDNVWYVASMIKENKNNYPEVELVEIDEDEYVALKEALETKESVEVPKEPEQEELPDDASVSLVKEAKIIEMSQTCNSIIVQGFDVELSDGETHHFDFSVDDQLNMISLKDLIENGEELIPYHAKDEACKFFSAQDIAKVIEVGTNLKTYHITYYNSLKQYIKSLRSIKTINNVYYGMDIPEKYQTEVLKALINQMKNEA